MGERRIKGNVVHRKPSMERIVYLGVIKIVFFFMVGTKREFII